MSRRFTTPQTPHPILFTPPELRQILSAYSEGVLQKHWKDYSFLTAPHESSFAVIERAEVSINNAVICRLTKTKAAKSSQEPLYSVYELEKSVLKTSSFLEALDAFRTLNPKTKKRGRKDLRLVAAKKS